MIAVDTSAILAMILDEPESDAFALIVSSNTCLISAATVVECHSVVVGRFGLGSHNVVDLYITKNGINIVDFDKDQLEAAKKARLSFGRGTGHPAQLNYGDMFSYALAKTYNIPLLFKGNDFIHTDVIPAIPRAA